MKWTYKNQINNFLTAVSNNSEGEIWVYGDITSDKWSDDDVTPTSIRDALDSMGPVGTLNIRVNSYGGSVYAGNSIINIIDSYRRKNNVTVNAYIEGIAASMGSGIPMVADKIYMAENAMMMVHKPYTLVVGNSVDLEKEIEILQKVEDALVKNYMRHFNGTEEQLRDMLAEESWLTADEALEYGLCDEIIEAVEIAASAKGVFINGKEFRHDADKIAAKFIPGTPIAKAEPPETKQKKGENKVFEYDEKLYNQYGVTEKFFKKLNAPADAVKTMVETIRNTNINIVSRLDEESGKVRYVASISNRPEQDELGIMTDMFTWEPVNFFIEANIIENAIAEVMGEKMTADEVFSLAKAGKEASASIEKAKAYDKLVNSAIEDALKNGVRAKGDAFNEARWRKAFANFTYEEVVDQSIEWDEEAKIALNAGKRVSEPYTSNSADNNLVNPDDYNGFC